MTGIVEGNAGYAAGLRLGLGQLIHMQHIHQEGVDVHDLGGNAVNGPAVVSPDFLGVVGPPFLQGCRTGTARGHDVVNFAGGQGLFQDVKVFLGFLYKAGKVAGCQGGNAATGKIRRHDYANIMILESFQTGLAHVGIVFVGHAAGKEQNLDAA